ncbi:MAG: flagellar hook capping FlgD N-terminal domain-containing protein [Parvularculaceae bacterium]|nr:flagellar hook capping FlgD N-terminal domain-containing protein [Parvularculaceae bacterium]
MDIAALTQPPAATAPAGTRIAADFNTFLTLLTAQLQNQDPLDPLDTDKFVSQLVEFSSVEQSIETNRNLEALIGLQSSAQTSNALALLGERVVFTGDRAVAEDGNAAWRYSVPEGASAVALTVIDADGNIVARSAGSIAAGEHDFIWAGGEDGAVYRLGVAAVDRSGASLSAAAQSIAAVTSVANVNGAPRLTTALGDIALADVTRVIATR